MMELARKLLLGACVASVPATGFVFATEIERTEWTPVPGATRYVGTLEEDGVTYNISTTSTWILTGKGTVKKIDAWSPRGPLRRNVETSAAPVSGTAKEAAEPAAPEPAQQEESAPVARPVTEEPAKEESA